jgi:glycosyltransferase involved in cell wall biosynthesis
MLILLDCRPLQGGPDNEKSRFIISCANILSEKRGVEWLFLADSALPVDWLSGSLSHRVLTRRTLPGKRGWKIWYDWQIPLAVKKYKPDLVMTTAGIAAARMKVPQCVWMTADTNGKRPVRKKLAAVYLKRFGLTLQSAQAIFSFSEKDRTDLIDRVTDKKVADKIFVIPPAVDEILPLLAEEKEKLKGKYTEGKEYFLTVVAGAASKEVVDLLKAFSLFKKRQRSNMQLVLVGGDSVPGKELSDRLANYKYRQDIHWVLHPGEEEWGWVTGASYALVAPFERGGLGIDVLNAWKAGVPVITTPSGVACLDIADEVLYAQPGDPASLAGQMMLIYKDEGLRNRLIGKGMARGRSFSWERSAGEVWAGIMGATKGLAPKSAKSAINS